MRRYILEGGDVGVLIGASAKSFWERCMAFVHPGAWIRAWELTALKRHGRPGRTFRCRELVRFACSYRESRGLHMLQIALI
jgi:hypothetical protein